MLPLYRGGRVRANRHNLGPGPRHVPARPMGPRPRRLPAARCPRRARTPRLPARTPTRTPVYPDALRIDAGRPRARGGGGDGRWDTATGLVLLMIAVAVFTGLCCIGLAGWHLW
jgi:hypothetical protein